MDSFIVVDIHTNNQLKNFKIISEISKETEDFFKECLDSIDDNGFEENTINECLGENMEFIAQDFKYLSD